MKPILHRLLITLPGLLLAVAAHAAPCRAATATEVALGSLPSEGGSQQLQAQAAPAEAVAQNAGEPADDALDTAPAPQTAGVLSLDDALARALAGHPGLDALEKEYWALDSLAWQAGRKPNPELELELAEFGGTQEALGVRALESSVTYTQPVERGGKREARETAASLERELTLWDIAELEYEVQARVRVAYAAVQAAQFELEQRRGYRDLVQRIYDTVAASVEAGRSARLELERFEIELARLDLSVASAERALAQAEAELAGTWGATAADFGGVAAAPATIAAIPPLAELAALLALHPAIARYDAEYEALCAQLDLEHANAVGDMALFGGVTRLNEIDETVFNVGVAWDLTTNDKNKGAISAAARRLEQVEDSRGAARRALSTELAALHQQAVNALRNYQAYGTDLLPAANEALALTEEGYRYGKFELLDVLDAQRTVLELEGEQTAARNELLQRVAAIEALLGAGLDALPALGAATEDHSAGHAEPEIEDMPEESPEGQTSTEVHHHD